MAKLVFPPTMRFGAPTKFVISIRNRGETDAHGVPLWIYVPDKTTVKLSMRVTGDSTFSPVDSLFFIPIDTLNRQPFKGKACWLFMPLVKAGDILEITGQLQYSGTASSFKMNVWTGEPLYGSPVKPYAWTCIGAIAKNIVGEIVAEITNAGEVKECISGLFDLTTGLIDSGIDGKKERKKGEAIVGDMS
ncbi:hypothetical protein [Spirosoma foliorum]|uniref:Uncharacterized protein n=1 Tax=Spirosoma foliorum TaxID=2710596 RepID=A0A7G5H1J4_9BACT|nr:hypothetical protein [Spirosoma foliorum]QMW04986.1 hypothetical protein H3H32_08860 [Spirosoma foliorum]